MYLRSVNLINWRSYQNATFLFPRPNGERNVILIMAPNEHGKSSFFEAVLLGLFGRDGLNLIPRARGQTGSEKEDRLTTNYSQFMQSVLNIGAVEVGNTECMVKLEWEDDDGEPIEVKRTWYFNSSGKHKVADDNLIIYFGSDRRPVSAPQSESNKEKWYRDWVALRFLQPSLAEYFLFDGEQVQRFASRDSQVQVENGIKGLLGLPLLTSLSESLSRYAQNRRTTTAAPSDEVVNKVKLEIEQLEEEKSSLENEQYELSSRLEILNAEIDDVTSSLGGRHEGSVAMIKSLLEDEERLYEAGRRAIGELTNLVAGDMAIAITGKSLINDTVSQLDAEQLREAWETGRKEGSRNLDRFISELKQRLSDVSPEFNDNQIIEIIEIAKDSWESLWHPPPIGVAEYLVHSTLTGTRRLSVIENLSTVGQHANSEANQYVQDFVESNAKAELKKNERLEMQRTLPEMEELSTRLNEVSEERGRLKERNDEIKRKLVSAEARIADKRAELGRYMNQLEKKEPGVRFAQKADAYAKLIDELIYDAVPFEVNEVAKHMTVAWKAMAHMSDRVDRIEISSSCEVKMLTSDGTDLHEIEKSAGANQVFTQALITAITQVSGRNFPFIVDTPLARLSREQRLGVLRTFTNRPGQVILLSTDQEVVDDKLDAIRHRILASHSLRVSYDRGIPNTRIEELDVSTI